MKKIQGCNILADLAFNDNYKKIILPVQKDLELFEETILKYFSKQEKEQKGEYSQILPIIKEFLSNKGKRLRPVLIFLFARALGKDVDSECIKLAVINELIHNATLIHDDIIDCAAIRRGKKTLNFDYDSKLAVLAGDYLLSEVLNIMSDISDDEIRKLHSKAVSKIILGELNQYFNRFKLFSIEDYVKKSKDKTARLFEAGLLSVYYSLKDDINYPEEIKDNIKNFADNFGIGFQILNDIENFNTPDKVNEDAHNGDFSAPFIYYAQQKLGNETAAINNIALAVKTIRQDKNCDALPKSKKLAQNYLNLAIENISFLEDNLYKKAIIDLCNLYSGKINSNDG